MTCLESFIKLSTARIHRGNKMSRCAGRVDTQLVKVVSGFFFLSLFFSWRLSPALNSHWVIYVTYNKHCSWSLRYYFATRFIYILLVTCTHFFLTSPRDAKMWNVYENVESRARKTASGRTIMFQRRVLGAGCRGCQRRRHGSQQKCRSPPRAADSLQCWRVTQGNRVGRGALGRNVSNRFLMLRFCVFFAFIKIRTISIYLINLYIVIRVTSPRWCSC